MPRLIDLVIEEMLDYIEQARGYVEDMTFEAYSSDQKTQRAVERCIEVISEASRHIPDDIKGEYAEIPWADVAAIGNIFRHEYHNIAARIVWDTVRVHLPQLHAVMRAIEVDLRASDPS
jgi:uncharacterized protein with HEPN domain